MSTPKNNYCTFYILRHGETDWNVRRIIQGHSDSKLTKNGQKQAQLLAKKFKSIHFDKIFSSDLLRAKETAEIMALEHQLEVYTEEVLRERKYGRFEGKSVKHLKSLLKLYDKLKEDERFAYKPFPDVESYEGMITRFVTFLRKIAVDYPDKTVLIVTHGGLIRILLEHLGFAPEVNFKKGSVSSGAYLKLISDGVDFFIKETKGISLV